ncbi:hypothetical protein [Bacteroides sp.]|uniref:hypothetical protein n=1 Tax=Bacteroides sp. TaxID=29523 RepID=UPI00258F0899|nr:hypothetical protein [Bacteroides sp.]
MRYNNWCYRCYNLAGATCAIDLNKCDGCKQNANDHLPPSKFKTAKMRNVAGDLNKKEENNMVITIIGSLTRKKEMDEIKDLLEVRGFVVNVPGDPEAQKEPLVDIQRRWIEKIEEADLIIAVPKSVAMTANGDSKYVLEFGESTSYEMAIARRFNKPILFG